MYSNPPIHVSFNFASAAKNKLIEISIVHKK